MHNNNIVEITDFESKELDIYARCNEPELLRGFGREMCIRDRGTTLYRRIRFDKRV